jgi:hypothetical protein
VSECAGAGPFTLFAPTDAACAAVQPLLDALVRQGTHAPATRILTR